MKIIEIEGDDLATKVYDEKNAYITPRNLAPEQDTSDPDFIEKNKHNLFYKK